MKARKTGPLSWSEARVIWYQVLQMPEVVSYHVRSRAIFETLALEYEISICCFWQVDGSKALSSTWSPPETSVWTLGQTKQG